MVGFKGLVRLWLRVYGWLSRVYGLVILWFSCEFSVVVVLVCGHVYHANCLEQITSFEELQHV